MNQGKNLLPNHDIKKYLQTLFWKPNYIFLKKKKSVHMFTINK